MSWWKRLLGIRTYEAVTIDDESQKPTDNRVPWILVRGIGHVDDKIRLELDWNDAFITHLKKAGYSGPSEEHIIQEYVAVLHHNIMSDLQSRGDKYV